MLWKEISSASTKFSHSNPIALNVIVPPSGEKQILKCETTDDYVRSYKGTLCAVNADRGHELIRRAKYSTDGLTRGTKGLTRETKGNRRRDPVQGAGRTI